MRQNKNVTQGKITVDKFFESLCASDIYSFMGMSFCLGFLAAMIVGVLMQKYLVRTVNRAVEKEFEIRRGMWKD